MNSQSQTTQGKTLTALTLLLAATLLVGFSMGRWLAPLAAWLGPVLFIRFYRDQRPGRTYPLLLAACIASNLIGLWQMFPLQMLVLINVLYGFMMTLPYVADRLLAPRIGGFAGTLVYPLAAGTLEFVNSLLNPFGTWGATGYSQYGNLPLMQLASVTGIIGITLLMAWFASVANWTWESRLRLHAIASGLAVFGAVMAAVFVFGFFRLTFGAPPSETVRVAGITAESVHDVLVRAIQKQSAVVTELDSVTQIRAAYFDATVREARAGAKVVEWPEVAGLGIVDDQAALITRAQEIARQEGIYLTLPLYTFYPGQDRPNENKLLVLDPAGKVVLEHVKYGGNFLEGSLKGDQRLRSVGTPFGVLSGVLCWDLDFPNVIRQAGQSGVGLLLVPSSDGPQFTPIHSQMAVFRAIENGMSVVRQVDEGLSIAADPYGRELAQVDFFSANDRTMVAQVPTTHVLTIYAAVGDLFGWLTVAGFGVISVSAVVTDRRTRILRG